MGPALVALLAVLVVAPALRAPAASPPADSAPGAAESASIEMAPFHDKAFLAARGSGAPVGLFFESDGCAPCRKMHEQTFRTPSVVEAAAGVRFFRVNLSQPDPYVDLVKKSFRVLGAPTVILFAPDGTESARRFGFIPPDDFVRMLADSRKPTPTTWRYRADVFC